MDLADFLLARIAEDEEVALEASWRFAEHEAATEPVTEHIARWDPARVLAECEAKRRIVEYDRQEAEAERAELASDFPPAPSVVLRLLALPYASHPSYRPEWEPTVAV